MQIALGYCTKIMIKGGSQLPSVQGCLWILVFFCLCLKIMLMMLQLAPPLLLAPVVDVFVVF